MTYKVAIIDDHKIVCDGLKALLSRQEDVEVVGQAYDGRAGLALIETTPMDVVIMDVEMSNLNGIDATRMVKQMRPEVKVIGLSAHTEKHFIIEMLKAGASGHVFKDCAFEELVAAVRAVGDGKTYLSPEIAGLALGYVLDPNRSGEEAAFRSLSTVEREVLQYYSEGKSTREIASSRHVSIKTVQTQRQHIMKKLGVHGVAEMTKYAIRAGLTTIH